MSGKDWREGFSTIARFASPLATRGIEPSPEALAARRLLRYILQSAARELLPEERVSKCLRSVIPARIIPEGLAWHQTAGGAGRVQVLYSAAQKRAHYGNLAQCASVWHDPVCASKITERRRLEMAEALTGCGFYKVMMTRTFQHTRGDTLRELRADFAEAKRRVKSGKGWIALENRFRVLGSISGTEATFSLENGFHLHDHSLYLFESEIDLQEFREAMLKRYHSAMGDRGRYVSSVYGLDVRAANDAVGDYVNKWGVDYELAKYPTKRGREGHYSAFQLLELYAGGTTWAGPVFQEYAAAMKGTKQLVWSRGLRELLRAGRERSDAEIVEAQIEDAVTLAWLSLAQWKIILKREKRGELLEVASSGNISDLIAWLKCFGIYLES